MRGVAGVVDLGLVGESASVVQAAFVDELGASLELVAAIRVGGSFVVVFGVYI